MKKYEIELDEDTSKFFEEISFIVQLPIEELLSDALFKQVELICRKVSEYAVSEDESLS